MRRRRLGRWARHLLTISTLAVALGATTATAAAPTPAASEASHTAGRSSPTPPDERSGHTAEHLHLGDDFFLPDGVPTSPSTTMGDRGFTVFPGDFRVGSQYTIRLLRSPGVAAYRPFAAQAARKLNSVLGPYFRSEDRLLAAPEDPTNFPGRAFQLRIIVSETSPCGSGGWIGCGGPDVYQRMAGQDVWAGGRIWLKPELATYSDAVKTQVLLHEIGHALNLGHYDAQYQGKFQIMRSFADGNVTSYRAGDRNGLRATRGRAPANDIRSEATRVSLGEHVHDATTWFARADSGDPELSDAFPRASRRSVWFRFRAGDGAVGRRLVVETLNDGTDDFDTVLGHYVGGDLRHANDDIAGGGRRSRITFRPLDTTTVHHFVLDGMDRGRGITQLRLRLETPP